MRYTVGLLMGLAIGVGSLLSYQTITAQRTQLENVRSFADLLEQRSGGPGTPLAVIAGEIRRSSLSAEPQMLSVARPAPPAPPATGTERVPSERMQDAGGGEQANQPAPPSERMQDAGGGEQGEEAEKTDSSQSE